MDLILLAGPPYGPALYEEVVARLGRGTAEAISPVEEGAEPGWRSAAARLAPRLHGDRTVLVAHGLAVPVAVAAALQTPPAALVLSNGPLRRVDPIAGILARAAAQPLLRPALLAATHPASWTGWLASSAGLRRAVVNPYVMDRDTVAALCGALVNGREERRALVRWVASLRELPDPRGLRCPTLLLWGDGDPLYPSSEAAFLESGLRGARHVAIPGGQHLHPVERPWEMADRVREWLGDVLPPAAG